MKAKAYELALLGSPFDYDDLSNKILEALRDVYKELVRGVQARDNPISFEELHKKLLNFKASFITHKQETLFPITANVKTRTIRNNGNNNYNSSNRNFGQPQPGNFGQCS